MTPTTYKQELELVALRDALPPSDLQPAQAQDVYNLEQVLGSDLPIGYVEFLTHVGCGQIYGDLATWYHLDVTVPGNVLSETEALQTSVEDADALPTGFLAVYDSCDGYVYGFARDNKSEYGDAVYSWDTDDMECRPVAETFEGFLNYLLMCDEVDAHDDTAPVDF